MSFKRSFCMPLACLLLVITAEAAAAAPTTVNLRVEGKSETLFEGLTLATDTTTPDGSHVCSGPSATTALNEAANSGAISWDVSWNAGFGDYLVNSINSDVSGPTQTGFQYWSLLVNNKASQVGGCQASLGPGDTALWAFVESESAALELVSDLKQEVGKPVAVNVIEYLNGYDANFNPTFSSGPSSNATVAADSGSSQITTPDGAAALTFDSEGKYKLKATKAGSIRSNSVEVCVYAPGSGACDTVRQGKSGVVADSAGPDLILGRPGIKVKGLRTLRIFLNDHSSISKIRIALLRRTGKSRCRSYNFSSERFNRKRVGCKSSSLQQVSAGVGSGKRSFAYVLRDKLPHPGRYRAVFEVTDASGNSSTLSRAFAVRKANE